MSFVGWGRCRSFLCLLWSPLCIQLNPWMSTVWFTWLYEKELDFMVLTQGTLCTIVELAPSLFYNFIKHLHYFMISELQNVALKCICPVNLVCPQESFYFGDFLHNLTIFFDSLMQAVHHCLLPVAVFPSSCQCWDCLSSKYKWCLMLFGISRSKLVMFCFLNKNLSICSINWSNFSYLHSSLYCTYSFHVSCKFPRTLK